MNTITDRERDKYHRMWQQEAYRQHSPGERSVREFIDKCPWEPGQSILDAGCGTGRVSLYFHQRGLSVTPLDITANCLDQHVLEELASKFVESPIHRITQLYDWIYCVDVLEHIPMELIDMTLDALELATLRGGFLQIACFEDGCGALIGEKLHLIVRPPAWWDLKIEKRWTIVEKGNNPQYAQYIISK